MAKVAIRRDELDLVLETVRRAAERTNSVVVVAQDRVAVTEKQDDHSDASRGGGRPALLT